MWGLSRTLAVAQSSGLPGVRPSLINWPIDKTCKVNFLKLEVDSAITKAFVAAKGSASFWSDSGESIRSSAVKAA